MQKPSLKVYGYVEPASGVMYETLQKVLASAFVPPEALSFSPPSLFFSYEGEYFPLEEVLTCMAPLLDGAAQGKLDYIDMEAWTLTRHFFQNGRIVIRSASLNHVMDSCQK